MKNRGFYLYLFMLTVCGLCFSSFTVSAVSVDFSHNYETDTVYWDGWPAEWMSASYTFVLWTDYDGAEYIYDDHYGCSVSTDKSSSAVDIDAAYIYSQGIRNGYAYVRLYVKGTCCTSKYIRHEGRCDNWVDGNPIWTETTW